MERDFLREKWSLEIRFVLKNADFETLLGRFTFWHDFLEKIRIFDPHMYDCVSLRPTRVVRSFPRVQGGKCAASHAESRNMGQKFEFLTIFRPKISIFGRLFA